MEAMLHYRPVSAFAGRTAQFAVDRFFGGLLDEAALATKTPREVTAFAWRAFGSGEMRQAVTLPAEVQSDAVQADLQDGVLRLELPKAESARPRTIPVNGPAGMNGTARSAPRAADGPTEGVVEKAIG